MPLQPFIASYVPEARAAVHRLLTGEVVGFIEELARGDGDGSHVPPAILNELEELRVLRRDGTKIRLATGVFLEQDIERIVKAVGSPVDTLVDAVTVAGAKLMDASPELRLFLGGVIGIGQGPGRSVTDEAWKHSAGHYSQTKVDFIERCPTFDGLGPDVLNKSVIGGELFTAVFIGPAGRVFTTFTHEINADETSERYRRSLNQYLADAYATLITGEIKNRDLLATAEAANLRRDGRWRSAVVTYEVYDVYQTTVQSLSEAVATWYEDNLPLFRTVLLGTAAGRHGVAPDAMMMNLWRIVRTAAAQRLYAANFFTDDIVENGTLTVFYDNRVRPLRDALG